MFELYLISRLDVIHKAAAIIIILSSVYLFIAPFIEDFDDFPTVTEILRKCKASVIAICVSILASLFVPTTEEALMIYAGGEIKEYIESNDKAKQIPDKAIEALWQYLEKQSKED